jgi:hypothetical protein
VGSKVIADWPGKAVVLYPPMVEVKGKVIEVIRVDYPTANGAAAAPLKKPAAVTRQVRRHRRLMNTTQSRRRLNPYSTIAMMCLSSIGTGATRLCSCDSRVG